MGWTYNPRYNLQSDRKKIIKEILAKQENEDGIWEIIAHCLRGNILWTVFQVTKKKKNMEQDKFIVCFLLKYGGLEHGWGYKDIDESMGPYYYTCPLSYLDMTPEREDSYLWRKKVREYWENKKDTRRKVIETFKQAEKENKYCIVILNHSNPFFKKMRMTSLSPLIADNYKIPWKLVIGAELEDKPTMKGDGVKNG